MPVCDTHIMQLCACAGYHHLQVEGLGEEAPLCGAGLLSDMAPRISGLCAPVPGKLCSALTAFLGGSIHSLAFSG